MSHLGSRVSALLDGRLPAQEEERLWAHVHSCHPCRDLVEREGWVKTRLAGLSFQGHGAPDRLKDSLLASGDALLAPAFPSAHPGLRHRGLVALGGGAVGAAVVGVLALGAAGSPQVERRAPVTDLNRPAVTSTPSPTGRPTGRPQRARPHRPARMVVVSETIRP